MTTYPYAARDAGGSVPPPPAATARSRRRRGPRVLLIGLLVAALVVAGVVLWQRRSTPFLGDECTATASGRGVDASPEQMGNAATIAGIALRRGLPARAATIAIATAIQESKLQNVDYGDRDSLGLFQQRPSQGWGTEAEVQDPVHATNAFYDALVKVRGYQGMEITKVAQKVQRSAYPEAYADHEPDARVLASALTGQSPAALSCRLDPDTAPAGAAGVAPFRTAVRAELTKAATTVAGPAAVRVPAVDTTHLWATAQYAVAQADRLGVARVYVAGRVWSRTADDGGWAPVPKGTPKQPAGSVTVTFSDAPPPAA
ncbi:hypothetical protein [Angustibacter aerolatus]